MQTYSRKLQIIIGLITILLIAFYAISIFYPACWNWSAFGDENLKKIQIILIAVAGLLLILPRFADSICQNLSRLLMKVSNSLARAPRIIKLLLWISLPFAVLYILRVDVHIYGDAQNLIGSMVDGKISSPLYNRIGMILQLISNAFGVVHGSRQAAANFLAFTSILAGMFFLYYAWKTSDLLIKGRGNAIICYIAVITSGFIAIFLGYVETYSVVIAWLAFYTYNLLLYGNKKINEVRIISIFLIGLFGHSLFIAFLPSLIIALNRRHAVLDKTMEWGISILFLLSIYFSGQIIKRGEFPLTIPFLPAENTNYLLFSSSHLLDFLNQLIMIGPALAILGLILIIIYRDEIHEGNNRLLLWIAMPTMFIAFIIDPHMGAARDWDILSIFAFPLILLAIALISAKGKTMARYILISVILLNLTHIAGFISINKDEAKAIDRIIKICFDDPHYQKEYYGGKRIHRFCSVLNNIYYRNHEALILMERIIDEPDVSYGDKIGLARLYYGTQDFPNAVKYFEKIDKYYSYLPYYDRYFYAVALMNCGEPYSAIQQCKIIVEDTTDMQILAMIGTAYLDLQELDSSIKYLNKAINCSDDSIAFISDCRDLFYSYKYIPQTARYQQRLLDIFPDSAEIRNGLDILLKNQGNPDTSKQLR